MRKKKTFIKHYKPDMKYQSITVGRFINALMKDGKKSVAEKVLYGAFDIIEEKSKEKALEVFEKALENAAPRVEVISKRVGGANYQVPREVRPGRKFMLAARWIIGVAKSKTGSSMSERLAEELMATAKNEGTTIKKKEDTHRMAEANRAFAHFSW